MSIASLLVHRMDVEAIPAVPQRDSSGGIKDDATQWTVVFTGVPCALNTESAQRMADFATAGETVTDTVITLQEGILLGMRLKVTDETGLVTYLRVTLVKRVRRQGTIGPFVIIGAEEVRLQ
jgi:hypothetical protein